MVAMRAKWTLDEYHQMVESGLLSGRHVELVEGDIVEMPPEGPLHAGSAHDLADYFREIFHGVAIVRDGHPITLPNHSEPEPDLAIAAPLGATYRQRHPYPEDIFLVVEISRTTLSYDLDAKARLYASARIRDYWVIDLVDRQVWVHRQPAGDRYQSVEAIASGSINLVAFPDVEVDVDRLVV
ncbi:MAG: Uma2 family endonuclease [Cyanobacteria bacterium J06639_1]